MILSEKKFLALLDIDNIINILKESKPRDIFYFNYTLVDVYDFDSLKEFFRDDMESLNRLIEGIKLINTSDKIKRMNLDNLLKELNDILIRLEDRK